MQVFIVPGVSRATAGHVIWTAPPAIVQHIKHSLIFSISAAIESNTEFILSILIIHFSSTYWDRSTDASTGGDSMVDSLPES